MNKGTQQAPAFWEHWSLHCDKGRQVWKYTGPDTFDEKELEAAFTFRKNENPNSGDKPYRVKAFRDRFRPVEEIPQVFSDERQQHVFRHLYKGWNFYKSLQDNDGHWPGDYGGPLFLLPGLIIASYISGEPFPAAHRAMMKRYILNQQNEDGGWGLHIEAASTMFGTVMQYVSLRLLGVDAAVPEVAKAREWIRQHGSATAIPSWGKFYLSVLGVYEWDGCHSLLPELWLLPKWVPVHPWRYWCHTRMVYLPMAYCYGHRVTAPLTPLTEALREELYNEPYAKIRWKKARWDVARRDLYSRPSLLMKVLFPLLNAYEKMPRKSWRKKALDFTLEYIDAEDIQTNHIDIGPVNQAINSIAVWHAYGKESPQFRKHVDRWKDYLWVAEDGMKMNGYNGSQLWDTAFATQAAIEGNMQEYFPDMLHASYRFIECAQVIEEVDEPVKFFRHPSKGAWPFSTRDHGWPISDCTSEGLCATLDLHHTLISPEQRTVSDQRLFDAIDVVLSYQNKDGGWATYENKRAPSWLELMNPSEVFGKIMADYSWTECTSACVQSLIKFTKDYPGYRGEDIARAIHNGIGFIKRRQRTDGSWEGAWAVCFTYGGWFAVEALVANGEKTYRDGFTEVSPHIRKACEFLVRRQNSDGGWGESFESCVQKEYIPHEESQVVNTAWALLTLMAADYPDHKVIEKGIGFLISRQDEYGDWAQEGISGVFNLNCMITYTAYRNVFPLWALGRYLKAHLR